MIPGTLSLIVTKNTVVEKGSNFIRATGNLGVVAFNDRIVMNLWLYTLDGWHLVEREW